MKVCCVRRNCHQWLVLRWIKFCGFSFWSTCAIIYLPAKVFDIFSMYFLEIGPNTFAGQYSCWIDGVRYITIDFGYWQINASICHASESRQVELQWLRMFANRSICGSPKGNFASPSLSYTDHLVFIISSVDGKRPKWICWVGKVLDDRVLDKSIYF